jgi:hypothetical protein
LKDLVLGQAKINKNLTKKLSYNDKMQENINTKIESLSSSVQNQLSFNKIIEKQKAQLVAAIPVTDSGKTSGKPESSLESVNMVSTRFGKPQHRKSHENLVDPPFVAKKEDRDARQSRLVGPHVFHNAICNLGASINVMSKIIYDKILGGPLSTANFRL